MFSDNGPANYFSTNVNVAGFVGVDANDNIVVQDDISIKKFPFRVFAHPQNEPFGKPLRTITFEGKDFPGAGPFAGGLTNVGHIWMDFPQPTHANA